MPERIYICWNFIKHPEDTDATEDTLDIVTIDNVLTDNLYNDLGIIVVKR